MSHHLCLGVEYRKEGEPGPYAPHQPLPSLGYPGSFAWAPAGDWGPGSSLETHSPAEGLNTVLVVLQAEPAARLHNTGSGTDCEGGTQDHSLKASTASGHVPSSFSPSCSGFCKHYKTAIGLWRMRMTTYRNRNSNSLSSRLRRHCLTQWSHKLNVRLQSQNTWLPISCRNYLKGIV